MNYLKLNPKTRTYVFRRAIPVELRPLLRRGREWTESLRTKDTAEAKRRVVAVSARVEALFQQAREQATANRTLTEANTSVTVPMVMALVQAWKEQELFRRAQAVMNDPLAPGGFGAEVALFNSTPFNLDVRGNAAAAFAAIDRRERFLEGEVRQVAERSGLLITPRHPAYTALYHLMQGAWREVLESEGRWRNFDFTSMPQVEPRPIPTFGSVAPPTRAQEPSAVPTLSEALDLWTDGGGVRGAKKPSTATPLFFRVFGAPLKRPSPKLNTDVIELFGEIVPQPDCWTRSGTASVPVSRLPSASASLCQPFRLCTPHACSARCS
jgi:hypothetical protein